MQKPTYICVMKQHPISLWSVLEVCWLPFTDHSLKISSEDGMGIDQC